MEHSLTLWVIFNLFIIVMLLVDLLVFNRKPHEITIRESLIRTGIKLGLEKDKEIRPEKNPLLILTRRFLPISRQPIWFVI